jgi:CubicO group peptidase (beta-lactamase class C family)
LLQNGEYDPIPHYGYPDYPDGGLRVTALDLADFLIAHTGENTLLSQPTLDEMFRLHVPSADADQALVWARYPDMGASVFGHDGGDDGISTLVVLDREAGDAAILLMNGDWYADALVEEMAGNLLRMQVP